MEGATLSRFDESKAPAHSDQALRHQRKKAGWMRRSASSRLVQGAS
jgi:hypothetical protein